jgi:arylsulfatase A-like enzyme
VQPNIVLVTVDCWRGDHLGAVTANKAAKAQTPCLNAIANTSHLFNNAHTCGGWTKLAMTSMFSSTYASMHGFARGKYNPKRPNLAVDLQANGYHTAGFTTNLVCGRGGGFDIGFDEFNDIRPKDQGRFHVNRRPTFGRLASHSTTGPLVAKTLPFMVPLMLPFYPTSDAKDLVDLGLKWLDNNHQQPYFLWLHFMDLHWPYRSSTRDIDSQEFVQMWQDRQHWNKVKQSRGKYHPGKERAERWQQLYAEEVEALDTQLGRFTDAVSKRDDWNNTALCITSDHGEELYEHGTWAHSWNQLHQEGTHVPLIIKTPNQTQGSVVKQAVSQLDIAPTLLDIAGVKANSKMLGQSLFNPDKNQPVNSEMFGHRNSHIYRLSIRHDGFHYIYDGENNRCFLYSINDINNPQQDIYSDDCLISKRFDKLRLAHIARGALDMLKQGVVVGEDEISFDLDEDPAVLDRLRALGYVD